MFKEFVNNSEQVDWFFCALISILDTVTFFNDEQENCFHYFILQANASLLKGGKKKSIPNYVWKHFGV